MKALSYLISPLNLLVTRVAHYFAGNYSDINTEDNTNIDHCQTLTTWTGVISRSWHDPENWSNGLPSQEKHAYIPTYPKGDSFPIIQEKLTIDFTIKNDGKIKNKGNLLVAPMGIIQNYGIFENKNFSNFINKGNFVNIGAFINTGFIDNQNIFSNRKMIQNGGTFLGEDRIINMKSIQKTDLIDGLNQEEIQKTSKQLHLIHS